MATEIESRHKKEIKALEGEKRAALKKAKGTKGKKAKEALAALEKEFQERLRALQERHETELAQAAGGARGGPSADHNGASEEDGHAVSVGAPDTVPNAVAGTTGGNNNPDRNDSMTERERKQAKAREKKLRKKQRETERQAAIEKETANAGPGLKQIEEAQIQSVLAPLDMQIVDVTADGHCLYRAVAAQTNRSYQDIRNMCADALVANKDEFAPFCEYTDDVPDFDRYVETVRNTAEWGGHLELRALGMALRRSIEVYSVQSGSTPLVIDPPPSDHATNEAADYDNQPIRLSYHLHYYALGEHYNQVVRQ